MAPPEVNVGGGEVLNAFMITLVIVVIDEGADLSSQVIREEVILQQDFILQSLMPSLDFTLGLRMIRRTPDMVHALAFQPFGQFPRDITGPIVR